MTGFKTILTGVAVLASLQLTSFQAHALGNETSGGGAIVQYQGQCMLLDFYLSPDRELAVKSNEPGVKLPITKSLRTVGIEQLNNPSFPLIVAAQEKLNAWEASSPKTVAIWREALSKMPIYYWNARFAYINPEFSVPAGVSTPGLKTMAEYNKNLGVLVAQEDFESCSKINQVGTLLHEAGRHVQKRYGMGFSNQTLQTITAAIALRGPQAGESLDKAPYADAKMLAQYTRGEKVETHLTQLQKEVCTIAKKAAATATKELCAGTHKASAYQWASIARDLGAFSLASDFVTDGVWQDLEKSESALRQLSDVALKGKNDTGVNAGIDMANQEDKSSSQELRSDATGN